MSALYAMERDNASTAMGRDMTNMDKMVAVVYVEEQENVLDVINII